MLLTDLLDCRLFALDQIIFKGGEQGCVSSASYYRVHIHTKDPPANANQHNRVQKGIFGDAPKKTTQVRYE